MSEIVKCGFYNILECGYYQRGTNIHQFGSINEILHDLNQWSHNKSIEETKLFNPAEGSELLPTYLLRSVQAGGGWMLVTWNQIPSTESGVASVMGNSTVNDPSIVMNAIEPGSIPGYATYFWFLPEMNLFASIRLKKRTQTGQFQMKQYLESALSKISSYAHIEEPENPDDEYRVLGYAQPGEEPQHLYPRFRTSVAKNKGNIEYILQHAGEIRKILCKETLQLNRPLDKGLWQSALGLMGLRQTRESERQDSVPMTYEFSPETFGLQEVERLIETWEEKEAQGVEWDDYGFFFTGQDNPHWLRHDILKTEVNLNVEWLDDELADPVVLLNELQAHKAQILRSIKRENGQDIA